MVSDVNDEGTKPRLNDSGRYLSKVVHDEDGNTIMLFPEDLMRALRFRENEILEWNVSGGRIVIDRRNIIDNKTI